MNDIEKCETTIAEVTRRRAACVQRGVELAGERDSIALAACTGDSKAAKRLAESHSAIAAQSSELASFDAAHKAAGKKLEAAHAAEAQKQDKANALALREELQNFCVLGMKLDEALVTVAVTAPALGESLTRIHGLGCQFPSHQQLSTRWAISPC